MWKDVLSAERVKNECHYFQAVFSSVWEHVESFTRDYSKIKSSLTNLTLYDKTSIESAFTVATSIIIDEWGYVTPCQVFVEFIYFDLSSNINALIRNEYLCVCVILNDNLVNIHLNTSECYDYIHI